jgi:soluble lytic murein transglycosylase-like protein
MLSHSVAVAALVVACLWPASAFAQIYAWRDASGTLVLSDRAIDAPADLYVVEGAPAIRTTRAVEAPEGRARYEDFILEYSARESLRPELVRAVIQVESGFNPRARSPKGAMGLMQLMPATARALGVTHPFDPEQNIRGGTRYLRMLLDRYAGDERLALAAYNAGSGAVDRHGGTVPPYRETREYVRKVGLAAGAGSPARGGTVLYKTIEIVDGRVIPRYSTQKPVAGTYDVVRP